MKLEKRSGKIENLTKKKIFNSILKASDSLDEDLKVPQNKIKEITEQVFTEASAKGEKLPIDIDWLEDSIERKLMDSGYHAVAKQYITYRYQKEKKRERKNLTEKLMAENVVNQNANVDENSFGGRIGEAASYIMKDYALNNLVSKMAKENHQNNEIYIHDLDAYAVGSHNCLSIPFDDLLANGFTTRQVDIRPANSVSTAMQLIAVIFQIQSLQQFGGVAATHLDYTMIPYVRKSFWKHFKDGLKYVEGMTDEEIKEFEKQFDE